MHKNIIIVLSILFVSCGFNNKDLLKRKTANKQLNTISHYLITDTIFKKEIFDNFTGYKNCKLKKGAIINDNTFKIYIYYNNAVKARIVITINNKVKNYQTGNIYLNGKLIGYIFVSFNKNNNILELNYLITNHFDRILISKPKLSDDSIIPIDLLHEQYHHVQT